MAAPKANAAEDAPAAEVPDDESAADEGWTLTRGAHGNSMLGQVGVRRVLSARPHGHLQTSVSFWSGGTLYNDFVGDEVGDGMFFLRGGGSGTIGLFDILEISGATNSGFAQTRIRDADQNLASLGAASSALTLGLKLNPLGALDLFDWPSPIHISISGFAEVPTELGGAYPDFINSALSGRLNLSVDLTDSFGLPFRFHVNGGYRAQLAHYLLSYDNLDQRAQFVSYFLDGRPGALTALSGDRWFYDQAFGGAAIELPLPFVTPFVEAFWKSAIGVPDGRGASGANYDFLLNPSTTITPGVRIHPVPGFSLSAFVDVGATGNGGYLTPSLSKLVDGQPITPLVLAGLTAGGNFDAWPFGADASGAASGGGAAFVPKRVCVTDAAGTPQSGATVDVDGVLYQSANDGCTPVYVASGGDAARIQVRAEGFIPADATPDETDLVRVVLAPRPVPVPSATVGGGSGAAVPVAEDTAVDEDASSASDAPSDSDASGAGGTDSSETDAGDTAKDTSTAKPAEDAPSDTGTSKAGTTAAVTPAANAGAAKGTLSGQVRASGQFVGRGSVRVTAADGNETSAKIRRGKFRVALEPGRYSVSVGASRHLSEGASVQIESGETAELKLKLKKAPRRRLAKGTKTGITLTTPIAFAPKTAEFLPAAKFVLNHVVDVFLARKGNDVLVVEATATKALAGAAQARADAIASYLKDHGVPPARIKTEVKTAEGAGARRRKKGGAPTIKLRFESSP